MSWAGRRKWGLPSPSPILCLRNMPCSVSSPHHPLTSLQPAPRTEPLSPSVPPHPLSPPYCSSQSNSPCRRWSAPIPCGPPAVPLCWELRLRPACSLPLLLRLHRAPASAPSFPAPFLLKEQQSTCCFTPLPVPPKRSYGGNAGWVGTGFSAPSPQGHKGAQAGHPALRPQQRPGPNKPHAAVLVPCLHPAAPASPRPFRCCPQP